MPFAIKRVLRPLLPTCLAACAAAWPYSVAAESLSPAPGRSADAMTSVVPQPRVQFVEHSSGRALPSGLRLGGHGLEFRDVFVLRGRELPYKLWGGRSATKQIGIGIDVEPSLRARRLRVGAYGTLQGGGLTLRLRY